MKSLAKLKPSKKDLLYFCLLAVIAFAFVFICSVSTSPLYPDGDLIDENDSCQFMTMGYEWLHGNIPYRDMFDHKGPYIFFVNMIGFALTGTRAGVFLVQVVNMFFILCGLDAIAKLKSHSRCYRLALVVVTLLILRQTYAGGDRTEEFCLPFIVYSAYFQLKYLMLAKTASSDVPAMPKEAGESSEETLVPSDLYESRGTINDHNPLWTLLYGVTFGICLMTRATNFITAGVGALCIVALLLYGKRFKCVLFNVLAFVGGTVLIIVPFSLYFATMGCFDEYIFATLTFNVLYSNSFGPWILTANIKDILIYLYYTIPFSCALVAGILFLALKKKRLAVYCLLCWCLEAYLFFSSAAFTFYAAITTAQCAILINAACELNGGWGKVFKIGICAALALYAALSAVNMVRVSHRALSQENPELVPAQELIETIPENERQEVMLFGNNWTKPLYLEYGIHPQYKYYNIQAWHSNFSGKVREEVHDQFANGDAKYIVVDETQSYIADILEERYDLVNENDGISLYELKEPNVS